MSNPLRAPTTFLPADKDTFPDSFFTKEDHPGLMEIESIGKDLNQWRPKLADLDMEPSRTIVIPKECTVLTEVHQTAKKVYATAQAQKLTLRVRSKHAHLVCSRVFRKLPDDSKRYLFLRKKTVGDRAQMTVSAAGGTIYSMGRMIKYYPKRNETVRSPVTRSEAAEAAERCGLSLNHLMADQIAPYPLVYTEGVENLKVNTKSDNGYPVGGKMTDELAASKVFGLAKTIRQQAVAQAKAHGPRSLYDWVREQEERTPEFWVLKGKTKGDYYKKAKVGAGECRFYNAFGRQVVLNMQVATQVLERQSRNILDNPRRYHSGIGISLHRGGAAELVAALDAQLADSDTAYVHVGDDSWVAIKKSGHIIMFALDCSSFDLTQHGACTKEVHGVIRDEMERVDAVAANLWHAVARERLVVLVGGAVVRMKHAGPSGMPLQSKVNDVLMDVMINRTLKKGTDATWTDAEKLDELLQEVGEGMGFKVRLESHTVCKGETLKECLEDNPFLFVGYYFYTEDNKVKVVADLPRSMAQMPYPSQAWVKKEHELEVLEAMRLGSIYMSQGIYPKEGQAAQEAFRLTVEEMLESLVNNGKDTVDESLLFAVSGDVHGPTPIPSLSGLLAAVRKPLEDLWDEGPEMEETHSEFLNGSWAADVEREERERGADRPVDLTHGVKPLPIRHKPIPTHPATWDNWGRPPPTAVWGPDKPPKQRFSLEKHARPLRNTRIGKVLPDEESEGFMSDLDDDDMYDEYY